MRFTVIASSRSEHQLSHQSALCAGLKLYGIDSITSIGPSSTKHVACWGWRQGKILRDAGHEVLVMERGYIGNRFSLSSLAWNGLNGYGEFPNIENCDSARFDNVATLKPWKHDGEYVLIMGQVPGDASLRGRNLMPWYESVAVLAADFYGLPVLFRPHPVAIKRGARQQPRHTQVCRADSLEKSMSKAAVVITYNSNSAVDAVLAGVPTIAYDAGSMAYPVTAHSIGELVRPDRQQWANDLAWCQWSIDEIRDGTALKGVLGMKGLI